MKDLNKAIAALHALGWRIELCFGASGFIGRDQNGRSVSWTPHATSADLESAVRSAVLKVAPGSCASRVWDEKGNLTEGIVIELFDERCDLLTAMPDEALTYTEAWINAAIALFEAGYRVVGDRVFHVTTEPATGPELEAALKSLAEQENEVGGAPQGKGETL